ncbi:MAG TPA: tRNA (N(6)-L-threonylcarbamoyladenosine(37)-C(2))-methylthiotransferase MtaB [Candidatus Marinimicrobia bacterium]|jgi:threonylcarbamoyladenosine tRNA methylthiotransferase MtaB|nr:tRNA (N(6)-L-threonylcarbamoyladenosine(37)-C(2))-methylthiotransferase MtaB [Candidatus Neomarinimicrobiota bacterium]MEE1505938.1 tRNA (N(6)-L-threonylcarbamoyladenosine(37)-C(2))-methylthiotransferase MtaB [Candidatus Neomarinimicrobiota bacterium]MEE1572326.1 tRNA (N(6)-L-threonylcarbamoyladenosine(37)-C(2))-methylthiotransferase MtaB [Candidatus Neomarinimicrobiota bacterium]HJL78663.1 tRNA (N(6)-L-threonylcarbamoyladenosine(37)-C(2))-methylthiotransferase MtaB [Candidatus Neomarinimicro|tara:strand:- start:1064 stop:2359 length:1296 start_codon:yes stop_codon:yes gene_type:complete
MGTRCKRIAFHTLGCKLNFSETATISRDFTDHGFEKVDYKNKADIYVLNTCSVTENADKEARKLIRQAKRKNPNSSLAIIGCYAQLKPKDIANIEGVDLVLGSEEKFNVLNHLSSQETNGLTKVIHSDIDHVHAFTPSYSSEERTRSFLKIQDGCDYSCSFCTVPLARGENRSDSIANTIKKAREVAETNAKEIVLTGVNIGEFGKGSKETFYDLIQQLDTLEGIDRIRISSIEPNLLTDQIIEFCAQSEKFMPHFHVPLQSGSNKILKKMKRRYEREYYEDRVKKIKSDIPDVCIGADVIVGFPGETEGDFLETYNFLNGMDISYLHVFTYSVRPNTGAVEMGERVSKETRAERSKMLHILSDKKRRYFYDQFINKNRPVLFENMKNGKIVGHADNYIKVQAEGGTNLINTIQQVTMKENHTSLVSGVLN